MVFSSLIFLWLFLPIVFVLNCLIKPQYSNGLLLAASLFFYAWGEPHFVFLIMISIVFNWYIGKKIEGASKHGHIILTLGILFNLTLLGFYKYMGFAIKIINSLWQKDILPVLEIDLPIGISFFTFQAIAYIVDIYRGESKAQYKLVNTALYISFFPQLIAGPIVKYKDISQQIERRIITYNGVALGFRRFIYGLSKKVLISNVLGKSADIIFDMDVTTISGTMAWIAALFYTFQIYYDFSGYSDMAIGLGKMFGFDIPENFNYPYMAKTVEEFWRKWHISLGTWFKEYVYIPLGGNRKGRVKTYKNLFVVFLLTGLWHGANFTFIIWGGGYGLLIIIEKMGLLRLLNKSKVISHIYLFFVVILGWVIFRIDNLKKGLLFIKRMIMPWIYTDYDISFWKYGSNMTIFIFICAILGMGIVQQIVTPKIKNIWRFSIWEFIYCSITLIMCLAAMAGNEYNPFIYFQF